MMKLPVPPSTLSFIQPSQVPKLEYKKTLGSIFSNGVQNKKTAQILSNQKDRTAIEQSQLEEMRAKLEQVALMMTAGDRIKTAFLEEEHRQELLKSQIEMNRATVDQQKLNNLKLTAEIRLMDMNAQREGINLEREQLEYRRLKELEYEPDKSRNE